MGYLLSEMIPTHAWHDYSLLLYEHLNEIKIQFYFR